MNALALCVDPTAAAAAPAPMPTVALTLEPARLALLGIGTVGSALLQRLGRWHDTPFGEQWSLVYAADSRRATSCRTGLVPDVVAQTLRKSDQAAALDAIGKALHGQGTRILIDATASESVADRHVHWLAQGIHVVSACKLGQGGSLARWRNIRSACALAGVRYGDSATVGAGLPLLRSLRELQAGGDRIQAIAGVLSGSLAWLCHHYDGLRPFSALVREARDAGYTEPDPREDLSGEDVRRKLLILARTAGFELETEDVTVNSLIPAELAAPTRSDIDAALPLLDAPMREHHAAAYKKGESLRFIARLEHGRARIGLESLSGSHPLAGGVGTDNRVAIWSDRYCDQPLVIQGPGAGAQVTAAALLDDVLRISMGSR